MSAVAGLLARRIAYDVLLRVERERAFADEALGRVLESSDLGTLDRALATRLVYGTIAWQRRLDWIADRWVRPPAERLDPEVRIALRLGMFQLFFSDRIPSFAAVETSVELVKGFRSGAAASLVNAVLRRAATEGAPDPPAGESPAALGLRFSHPDWLVARFTADLGPAEAIRLLAANNEAAPLTLRAPAGARQRLLEELEARDIEAVPGTYSPLAVRIGGVRPALLPRDAVAQGEASQLVPFLLGAQPGQLLLDACAAPGGKATEIANLLAGAGRLVAADVSRQGARRVRELARRIGARDLFVVSADASSPPFRAESFDAVLVDAPCTGVGTLRSHPEIRWRIGPADLDSLARRQRSILDGVASLVRRGGALVYATCSLLRAENEEVVGSFLESHREFRAADPEPFLPESARPLARGGALRTSPHEHGLEGFYAVRIERRG